MQENGAKHNKFQDNFIGANQSIFDLKFNGTYRPYEQGISDDIFIKDPRDSTQVLLGEVGSIPILQQSFAPFMRTKLI